MEMVDKSCYLGDVLDAGGGCDSAVTAGICLEKVLYSNWKRVNWKTRYMLLVWGIVRCMPVRPGLWN